MKSYRNVVLSYNPVAYWPMNEASGTTLAATVGGQNLTLTGTYTLGNAGPINRENEGAPFLDGSTGYATASSPVSSLGTSWTVGIFARYETGGVGSSHLIDIAGTGLARIIFRPPVGDVFVRNAAGTSSLSARMTYTANEWHLYALTADGTNIRTYLDGVLSDTKAYTQSQDTSATWAFGRSAIGGAERYKGRGSHWFVALNAMTASQLLHLYLASVNGVTYPIGSI